MHSLLPLNSPPTPPLFWEAQQFGGLSTSTCLSVLSPLHDSSTPDRSSSQHSPPPTTQPTHNSLPAQLLNPTSSSFTPAQQFGKSTYAEGDVPSALAPQTTAELDRSRTCRPGTMEGHYILMTPVHTDAHVGQHLK